MADPLINVKDPDSGELVGSVPQSQLQTAVSQGYQQATPEEAQNYFDKQQYSGPVEQAKTALEGAADAASFGTFGAVANETGLSTPEARQKRREQNPISRGVGQVGGIALSNLIPGAGEAADVEALGSGAEALNPLSAQSVLSSAGKGVSNAIGLTGDTALQKIGSSAVQNAVESGLFQAGDEVSKHFSQDPNQTGQTALLNTGLGSLFGAGLGTAIGVVSPAWKSLAGDKTSSLLEGLQKRLSGEPIALPPEVQGAVESSGIQLPPEVRSGLTQNPQLQKAFNILQESKTDAGLSLKDTMDNFRSDAADSMAEALGKDPENITPANEISKYDAGKNMANTMAKELEDQIGPVAERFEARKAKFGDLPIGDDLHNQMQEKLAQLAIDQGWVQSPSSDIMKEFNRVVKELPLQKNLKNISQYQTAIGNNTADFTDPALTRAGSLMKKVLRDTESDVMTKATALGVPDDVAQLAQDRSLWGQYNDLKDDLNQSLHIKDGSSIMSFIKGLKEAGSEDGETVLRRLSGDGDAALLKTLEEKFPKTAQLVKNHNLDMLVGKAALRSPEGVSVNSKALSDAITKMSPEMKAFTLPEGAGDKISGINSVLNYLPKYKTSGTAGNADSLWSMMPGAVMGGVAALTGHNPIIGAIIGQIGKLAGRDAPDAVRLAMLKFLGSDKEVNAPAMKAMIDYIHNTIQGQTLLTKGAKSIFEGSEAVLPTKLIPDDKSREKLDSKLQEMQTDPKQLFETGGELVHYMPDHGQALAQVAAQSSKYLNSLRPMPVKQNPLDEEQKPSQIQKAKFNRALDIAQQPLMIFQHIKDGTILPDDVINLKMTNPNMYNQMVEKVQHQMMDSVNDETHIPYKTRLGLSLFMGQTLDSTISPQAIQAAQPQLPPPPSQGMPTRKGNMKDLGKIGSMNQTPQQSRQANRDQS